MPTKEEVRAIKTIFSEAVDAASAHKIIVAAKALRELYSTLTANEKSDLDDWVRLRSDLLPFITGEDKSYFIQVAVRKKGLRRANLEHLERYSSEATATIESDTDDDEYRFNIWKSEWSYVQNFLKQFDIAHRILGS